MEMIFQSVNSLFSYAVPFIVLLGILVFVHEFGHFIVARLCGVRVEVFSLGFGKKIFQYKSGDTNYCVSIVPLGGYVKMFGDQLGVELSEEDKKYSFNHKNVWQRIAVVLAGPLMNFFFAIFVFTIVAGIGEDFRSPIIGDLAPQTTAYTAGFRPGDRVLTVNQTPIRTWDEFEHSLATLHDTQVDIEVLRNGNPEAIKLSAPVVKKPNPNILSTDPMVGEIEGLSPLAKAAVVGVKASSPLSAIGLKTGDRIVAINGQPVLYWRDLSGVLEKQDATKILQLDIERNSSPESIKPETMSLSLAPIGLKTLTLDSLQIESADLYLGAVLKDTPAQAAGLMGGDRITQIGEKFIEKWEDVVDTIKAYDGKGDIAVKVLREGSPLTMNIVPRMISQMTPSGTEDRRYTIGIAPHISFANPELIKIRALGPIEAIKNGTKRTWDVSVMTVMSFVRLFEGKVSSKNIGGVISIGQAASETFKIGLSPFLRMMGLISVNLFILNLLPIPVLDGGHLLFYTIEGLKGAPMSLRKMELLQQIGLVLLVSLMVFSLFNDFSRLFGL